MNSRILFLGDNSVVYLSKPRKEYHIIVSINNNSVLFFDDDVTTNGMRMVLSEEKNIFIGKHCLFSFGIWFRLADPHLIYDVNTKKRINYTKSIYLGDHVWVGQNSLILKGTQIGSGTIIGANSVVSNKKLSSNTIWAGNPAKFVKKQVFYNIKSVHNFVRGDTLKYSKFEGESGIYYKDLNTIDFEEIENKLSGFRLADEKIEYLNQIKQNSHKNRFYCDNNEINSNQFVIFKKFKNFFLHLLKK